MMTSAAANVGMIPIDDVDEILLGLSDGALIALLGTRCNPRSVAELCELGLAVEEDGCWNRTELGVAARRRVESDR